MDLDLLYRLFLAGFKLGVSVVGFLTPLVAYALLFIVLPLTLLTKKKK